MNAFSRPVSIPIEAKKVMDKILHMQVPEDGAPELEWKKCAFEFAWLGVSRFYLSLLLSQVPHRKNLINV